MGALLYGAAFIYFAHTTRYALVEEIPDYVILWEKQGTLYTVHGSLMIAGGALFTIASLRTGVLPRWTIWRVLAGVAFSLIFSLLPVPTSLQPLGRAGRNIKLIGMGNALLCSPAMRLGASTEKKG